MVSSTPRIDTASQNLSGLKKSKLGTAESIRKLMAVPSDGERLRTPPFEPHGDQEPRQRNRREHGADEAQGQGDAEALHRPRAHHVENDRDDQRRDVAVEDRREGLLEPE